MNFRVVIIAFKVVIIANAPYSQSCRVMAAQVSTAAIMKKINATFRYHRGDELARCCCCSCISPLVPSEARDPYTLETFTLTLTVNADHHLAYRDPSPCSGCEPCRDPSPCSGYEKTTSPCRIFSAAAESVTHPPARIRNEAHRHRRQSRLSSS